MKLRIDGSTAEFSRGLLAPPSSTWIDLTGVVVTVSFKEYLEVLELYGEEKDIEFELKVKKKSKKTLSRGSVLK